MFLDWYKLIVFSLCIDFIVLALRNHNLKHHPMSIKIKKLVFPLSFVFGTISLLATSSNSDKLTNSKKLISALENYRLDDAKRLISEKNIDFDRGDEYGRTPLIIVARDHHIEILNLIINNMSNIDAQDVWGRTALISAILFYSKKYEINKIARKLIDNGANPETADINEHTALTIAVKKENRYTTKYILDNWTNAESKNKQMQVALEIAKQRGYKEIVKLIKDHKNKLLVESNLDFSPILDREINIIDFLKSLPSRVAMTSKQISDLKALIGHKQIEAIIKSKEIISFEQKSINTSKAISECCDLPADILYEIICYTDTIATCRMKLLHNILKKISLNKQQSQTFVTLVRNFLRLRA